MRDKLKNADYFKMLIEREKNDIIMFEGTVKKVMIEKGESDRGVRNGYNILICSYQKMMNLLYSYGEDPEIIKEWYEKLLYYYSKMWDREYGYIELIKILSLAVLFGIDKCKLIELEERLMNENFDDYLVNILVKEIDSSWTKNGTEFEFPGIYDCLKDILENKESSDSSLLKEYLEEKWYGLHKQCAWYNTHKSKQNTYCGYWSFEAGAIAKIIKIDDANLKDVSYYPYDLVRYKK